MSFYIGLGIHQVMPDSSLASEKQVRGFPDGAKINFVSWSNDCQHLAFSVRIEEEERSSSSSKLRVWVADVETGTIMSLFQSLDIYLNAIFYSYVWVDNSTLLICTIRCVEIHQRNLWFLPA